MKTMPRASDFVSASPIKVAIVEDQADIRECLEFLINDTEGFSCIAAFGSIEEALEGIAQDLPDVVLADIGLAGINGIEGARILEEQYPTLLILMNTVYEDDDLAFQAIRAGACGYLLKKMPPTKLLESIRDAVGGRATTTPGVAGRVTKFFLDVQARDHTHDQLSPDEITLLKLFVEGYNSGSAAMQLGVSVDTVNSRVRNIFDKLQAHSR